MLINIIIIELFVNLIYNITIPVII